jgi:hypothetical protein
MPAVLHEQSEVKYSIQSAGSRRTANVHNLRQQISVGIIDHLSATQFAGAVIQGTPPKFKSQEPAECLGRQRS